MDIDAYLKRLNYDGPRTRTLETLQALHQAHLLAVPFENLDIHLGRPIALEEEALYDKIVRQRRGGFCYERVMENGKFGPEFDHLTLLVPLEERWLADVGFGDSFREPLRLEESGEQIQYGVAYRLRNADELWTLDRRFSDQAWEPQYRFTLQPRQLTDFAGMCRYHQTSPASHFTQKRICSRATPEGRVTLSDMRLIITASGQRQETVLQDEEEYRHALEEHFGIDLTISKS
ncbi:acetyltransferase [candidate division KSB1 bacterium]|nr:MAG: acetyltransferase [candidate division KSB1 bacterium]